MSVTTPEASTLLPPAMLAEVERVRASGILGASGRLVELFEYLVARTGDERSPKEAEIALAVFGKTDADSMRDDPVARVYIHRLRKRLDDFYLRNGLPGGVRLDIPKGDYRIVCLDPSASIVPALPGVATAGIPGQAAATAAAQPRRSRWGMIAAAAAALLVAGNIGAWAVLAGKPGAQPTIADTAMWSEIANSQRPLLVVVGVYYMFG